MRARLILCAAATLAACSPDAVPLASPGVPVRTVVAESAPHRERHAFTGDVVAACSLRPGFARGGTVTEVSVDVGDAVAEGDELARIDAALLEADRDAAAASVRAARSRLELARSESERRGALGDRGFAAQAALDAARTGLDAARAGLASARAELDASEDALDRAVLVAPEGGVVTARRIEPGELVPPGAPVLDIAADGALRARFDVPEAVLLEPLDTASIRLALVEAPDVRATGRVERVLPAVDPDTGTVRVWTTVEGATGPLPLGAAVDGSIESVGRPSVRVPGSALDAVGGRPAVWVVDPASRVPAARTVDVLDYTDGFAVLSDGVEPGAEIVSEGVHFLKPGIAVDVAVDVVGAGEGEGE